MHSEACEAYIIEREFTTDGKGLSLSLLRLVHATVLIIEMN